MLDYYKDILNKALEELTIVMNPVLEGSAGIERKLDTEAYLRFHLATLLLTGCSDAEVIKVLTEAGLEVVINVDSRNRNDSGMVKTIAGNIKFDMSDIFETKAIRQIEARKVAREKMIADYERRKMNG